MLRKSLLLITPCIMLCPMAKAFGGEVKTADEAIAKYIEAVGGREVIDSLKSMRMTGKTVMMGGMEAPITIEFKVPKKLRIDFTFQGMTGTQAFDGTTGWFIMPFMGKTDPEKMSADQVEEILDQADVSGPLVDYKGKGHQVELVGMDEIQGSPTYKLKVTKKNGRVEYHHLDAEYFLTVAVKGKREFQGTEMDFEVIQSDFKKVEGFMVAHSIEQKMGGVGMTTMIIEKVELNVEIPDDRFTMPEVEKTEDKPSAKKPGDAAEDENKEQPGKNGS